MPTILRQRFNSNHQILFAGAVAMTIATLGSWTMPMIAGTLIDVVGLSGLDAGFLISAEMAAMAAATFATAALLKRTAPGKFALAGVAVIIVGNVLSAESGGQEMIASWRVLTGLGEGMLYAAGSATVARLPHPDRAFAVVFVVQGIVAAVLLAGLPFGVEWFGARGLFLSLAIVPALGSVALLMLPKRPEEKSTPKSFRAKRKKLANVPAAFFVLGAMLLVSMLEFSVWSHSEQIAGETGMSPQTVGLVLSISTIFGLLGSVVAALLDTRYGRVLPIGAAIIGQLICGLLCIHVQLPLVYAIGFFGWSFTLFFLYPYLFGMASTLDPEGRWAASGSGMLVTGQIIGPSLSAYAVSQGGYGGLSGIMVCFSIGSLVMLWFSSRLMQTGRDDNIRQSG